MGHTLELRPFCRYTASVIKPEFVGDTYAGRRVIVGVREARFTGPDFAASQQGESSADWLLTHPDGTAEPDVRMTIRTDDGARIFVQYRGRADWSAGPNTGPVYAAVIMETAEERYTWMNSALFVAKGGLTDGKVDYRIFQLV